LVDDRALGGALQRDEHLIADRGETFAEHVHGEPVGHPRSSTIRLPAASSRAAWPGSTSVVAAGSSITHGPGTQRLLAPVASSARTRTGTSRGAPNGSRSTSRVLAGGSGPEALWSFHLISAAGSIALTRSETTSSGASSRNEKLSRQRCSNAARTSSSAVGSGTGTSSVCSCPAYRSSAYLAISIPPVPGGSPSSASAARSTGPNADARSVA